LLILTGLTGHDKLVNVAHNEVSNDDDVATTWCLLSPVIDLFRCFLRK
jgi:hypothetical protein